MFSIDDKPIEYSAEWKGPVKSRSCTDTSWLVIFLAFMACWFAVGYYALTYGGTSVLEDTTGASNAPVDSEGRKCGFDFGVENAPYLVFFDLSKCDGFQCNTPSVCRENCPDINWYYDVLWDFQSVDNIRKNMICKGHVDLTGRNKEDLKKLIHWGECAAWYLQSKSFKKRCIPESVPVSFQMLISENELENARNVIIGDIKFNFVDICRIEGTSILAFIAIGAAVCLVYLILLRWLAFQFTLISAAIHCALYSYLSYYFSQTYARSNNSSGLILCIVFAILAALIVLIVLLLWKRIKAACQLIKEASTAVVSISSSLLYPILPSVLHVGAIVFFIVNTACLISIKNLESWQSGLLVVVNLVGFLWFHFFVTALGQMILAFVFASWYWTFDKLNVPYFTVFVGIGRTIRYHLGTVAFGSLLITICRLIRIIVETLRRYNGDGALFCHIIFCCILMFIRTLERFLKFMNRNAYIICAIYGEGLCNSASVALSLIIRNADRVIVLNNVVSWVLWLGKLLVTAAMGVWAWSYYEERYGDDWILPVVLVVVGTWFVTSAFFSVFTVAVDTIFLCFLEDTERNDGTSARPYYMSRKLRKLLQMESEY